MSGCTDAWQLLCDAYHSAAWLSSQRNIVLLLVARARAGERTLSFGWGPIASSLALVFAGIVWLVEVELFLRFFDEYLSLD
jgi:hypothetical protein